MRRANDARMADVEDPLDLVILVGHRARRALDQFCAACDGRVGSEVLLLNTLGRLGPRAKRCDLARALGWNPSRVSQVVDGLIARELVVRMRGHWLTETGAEEAALAGELLRALETAILEGVGGEGRRALIDSLRRVADNADMRSRR